MTQKLMKEIDAVLTYEKLSMMRRKEWGKINFLTLKGDFHQIYDILDILHDLRPGILYVKDAEAPTKQIQDVRKLFERISKFDARGANAVKKRDAIVAEFKDQSARLLARSVPWVRTVQFF